MVLTSVSDSGILNASGGFRKLLDLFVVEIDVDI